MAIDSYQAATALLTEHLQYTPLSLIDDIIDMVNNLVYQGVSSLENGLFSTPPERLGYKPSQGQLNTGSNAQEEPEYPEAKQEIEEGLHKLETLLESTVDKNFDKFEIYVLRNLLAVPNDLTNWVRLSHYENLQYPPPANAATPESVQLLRRRVAASQTVSNMLLEECNRNQTMLTQLTGLLSTTKQNDVSHVERSSPPNFGFLTEAPSAQAFKLSPSNPAHQPLTMNTTFSLSQIPALRAILAELRPKLATLQSMNLGMNSAKDEQREERRGYIEQRTRAHLERNGLAVAENTNILSGRNIDNEEIQALEKVAAIFSSS